MGRLQDLRIVDPVLTTIARGYTNADFVAENLFPYVPITKEGGKIPAFGKEEFLLYNTERAVRGDSNRIAAETRNSITISLTEHDLEYPVDYRESQEDIFPLQEYATYRVTKGIQLQREMMAATLAQSPSNYPSSNVLALSGTSTFSNASTDPVEVIDTCRYAMAAQIGTKPNTMIIGASAYLAIKNNPNVINRLKYTAEKIVTVDILKAIFGMQDIVVGEAVYSTDAGTTQFIWGPNVILAYVPDKIDSKLKTPYRPSFGYTLQKSGYPMVDVYFESGYKVQLVRATDIFDVQIVGSDAGYLIANVVG